MATYEGVYGVDSEMSKKERREREILKVHPYLPKRRVKTIGYHNTMEKNWYGSSLQHKKDVGKTGIVREVHSSITEAVKVTLDGHGTDRYWHHKDLEMFEDKPIVIEPVLFDPMKLVV
jgi:hypothetical protein